jgi:hypothetical protein
MEPFEAYVYERWKGAITSWDNPAADEIYAILVFLYWVAEPEALVLHLTYARRRQVQRPASDDSGLRGAMVAKGDVVQYLRNLSTSVK